MISSDLSVVLNLLRDQQTLILALALELSDV